MKMDGQLVDEERHDDEYSPANRPMKRENHTKIRARQIKPVRVARNARETRFGVANPAAFTLRRRARAAFFLPL
jgi:hypothetical protein